MDLVDKISLAEKTNNKNTVLKNTNLSDEQKASLYNKFFKKHLSQENKDLELVLVGYSNPKTTLLDRLWVSTETLPTNIQNQAH